MSCDSFDQRWEFRRKDSEFACSSDESESSSNTEPVLKKQKLVSSLILLEKEETSDSRRPTRKCDAHFTYGKPSQQRNVLRQGAHAVNDIENLMESILEELRVERENLLLWMREEMYPMMGYDTTHLSTRRERIKGRNCRSPSIQKNVPGGNWGLLVELNSSSNPSGQNTHSTFPTVLSQHHAEKPRLDPSNLLRMNSERGNALSGSFVEMGPRDTDCFDRTSVLKSSTGNGFAFAVPLHLGLDSGFSVLSRGSLENPPRNSAGGSQFI